MFNTSNTNKKAAKYILMSCFATSIMLTGCGSSTTPKAGEETAATETAAATDKHYAVTDLVDLDLSADGIPVITKAPKDAKVMKYEVNGDICVYGGKFFKLTFAKMDGALDENFGNIKALVEDKEMNPSFDKFEEEGTNSFLKKNKEGKLAFTHGMEAFGKTFLISEGMPYDISPDQFSDYSAEDVKVMYEAAKATKFK